MPVQILVEPREKQNMLGDFERLFDPEHVDISNNHFWYTMKAEIKKLPVVPKIKERTALAGFGLADVFAHKKSRKGGKLTQRNVNFIHQSSNFWYREKESYHGSCVCTRDLTYAVQH